MLQLAGASRPPKHPLESVRHELFRPGLEDIPQSIMAGRMTRIALFRDGVGDPQCWLSGKVDSRFRWRKGAIGRQSDFPEFARTEDRLSCLDAQQGIRETNVYNVLLVDMYQVDCHGIGVTPTAATCSTMTKHSGTCTGDRHPTSKQARTLDGYFDAYAAAVDTRSCERPVGFRSTNLEHTIGDILPVCTA